MEKSTCHLDLLPRFFILMLLLYSAFPTLIFGIRRNDAEFIVKRCKNTVQGRYLLSDSVGYVCNAITVDPSSRCCPEYGKQFSCQGCNLVSECCDTYEYCVSCCLNPQRTSEKLALNVKIAKPVTSANYASVFDFCAGRCRHNSANVVHENTYSSDFHHCFSLQSNSSGVTEFLSETRLTGISIVVGDLGESCNSVCKLKGQSCVSNKLAVLNKCEFLQKHMNCKAACIPSVGADQPAEVVEDAPQDLNPGACLYSQSESVLSCDGSHQYTKRLCPCA
ncbi:hypothetical protein ZOSMA_36G00480 [Zostera marina]|uniref:SREBP regulating gene protein n=1 Tax=Zostera marina TaxID=29655 RepID=A0A0K9P5Y3_ZOSMR|nr:hypothetical protein ZOSMA_36G00480 [Zostera marina]